MKRVINRLQNFRPLKLVTVFVLGFFLLFTQSCAAKGIAAQPPQPSAQAPNINRYDPTKDYPLSTPQGGMNNFSDVDPRAAAGEKTAEVRAKALRDNAKRNVDEKGIDSAEQYARNYRQGTPLGERVKNLGEDINDSAEELGKGVVKGTKRGVENLKDNTQNAAENLTKNVQRGVEDAGDAAKRTLKD